VNESFSYMGLTTHFAGMPIYQGRLLRRVHAAQLRPQAERQSASSKTVNHPELVCQVRKPYLGGGGQIGSYCHAKMPRLTGRGIEV
jgi:hypothetical protein